MKRINVLLVLISTVVGIRVESYHNTTSFDQGEAKPIQFLDPNNTLVPRQNGYGLIELESQHDPSHHESGQGQYGLVAFEGSVSHQPIKFADQTSPDFIEDIAIRDDTGQGVSSDVNSQRGPGQPLKFEEHSIDINNNSHGSGDQAQFAAQGVKFQDDNGIESQKEPDDNRLHGQKQKKRRRRRRRKPRLQQQGPPGLGYPGASHGYPGIPGTPQGQNPFVNPGLPAQFYRPHRRPKPSGAIEALSAVTGALSSIALHDDQQCVPRLLCEAAGGRAEASGSSGLLQSIAGLQPLLTLLSAYNGASASPLFVFGRAVFLGMTSKGKPGSCRYAYPLCPTDPEQLVHYLNNHNGGFFRFFGAPQLSNPQHGLQNVEQFYNQLIPGQNEQNYGIYKPNAEQYVQPNTGHLGPQNYGLYNNLANHNYDIQRPSLYNENQQNYGLNYPYNQNKFGLFKNNEQVSGNRIQKRIQNVKQDLTDNNFDSSDNTPKWQFPKENFKTNVYDTIQYRGGRHLKFPDTVATDNAVLQSAPNKQAKGFLFPGTQSNRQYQEYDSYPLTSFQNNQFKFDESYVGDEVSLPDDVHHNNNYNVDEDSTDIVYVVRGNGDPKYPEIFRLRPGQRV